MRAHINRLATVVILPVLAMTAACGESSGDETEQRNTRVESSAAASSKPDTAEPPLTEQQLKKVLLTADAVDGFQGTDSEQQPLTPKADKSECQPLADLTAYGTGRSPQANAFANRTFLASEPGKEGTLVTIALLSYEKEGTSETIEGIRSALAACGDGFETSNNNQGQTISYTKAEERDVAAGGDQSIAVELVVKAQGFQVPMDFVVVSSGSTLAQFMSMNVKDPKGAAVPEGVVSAQLGELAKAASE
jgi:hypothetical protein